MYRMITFVVTKARYLKDSGYEPLSSRPLMSYDVTLEGLSPLARRLAEGIYTTENADDLSLVWVQSNKTNETLYRADMVKWKLPDAILEKQLADLETAYPGWRTQRPIITWAWDCLRNNETPEAYFERHAGKIASMGSIWRINLEMWRQ